MSDSISVAQKLSAYSAGDEWNIGSNKVSSRSPEHPSSSSETTSYSSATSPLSERSVSPPELPRWTDLNREDIPASVLNSEFNPLPYELRLKPRESDNCISIALGDQDATANYDPNAKHDPWLKPPVECFLRRKRPQPTRPFNYAEYRAKRPKTVTWQRGRLEGKRKVVTFKLESANAAKRMKSYGSSLDNWPGPAYTTENGEPNWEAWWKSHDPVPEEEYLHWNSYDFRDRPNLSPGDANDEDLSLEDVTLGHPEARGCKACFSFGHPCPLLEGGSKYPCNLCAEDEVDCELLLEPPEKARCLYCISKKIICSFASDPTQRGACQNCNLMNRKCIAGPKSGRTRTGPCYDVGSTPDEANARSFVTCTQCRKAGKWCSLKGKRQHPPCKRCLEADTSCTFESLSRRAFNRQNAGRKQTEPANVSKDPLPRIAKPRTRLGPTKSSIKTIVTKLANPIQFNFEPTQNDTIACHWCDDLIYGILGLGEVQIEVIDYHDQEGYIEIGGGHTAAGHAPSRMCDTCTLERLMIAACHVHELEPIEGSDPATFDFTSITEHMMPGMAASAPFQWCSVCPAPAFFKCAKKSGLEGMQDGGECLPNEHGCGLGLCEFCAVSLVGEHDGNLGGLIDAMSKQRADEGFGLRADVDFLHPHGEVLRRMSRG
ncbi:uncharacterized protein KY384_004556 [Bacidia gigantensis]|uniref:uncharacterized protein n=1 Tax=Bacidia gigantensis TaxID=2732470 RepID=UPI001D04BDEB|nr:uncharacterized protein KY384_004556 [Bacidia gigantensis]KAG8531198.1 hypothetical protein KY384_004556 [Bacidia gigantensis]